jgi:hypothetical protein
VIRVSSLLLLLLGQDVSSTAPACRQISRRDRTFAGVVLGGMRLENVRRRLGPGTLQTTGDGHGFRQALCYRSTNTDDDTVLVIANENSERHDTRVTSVYLGPLSTARVDPTACRRTSAVSHALGFGTGPRSGAPFESVARWLGVTSSDVERACAPEVRPASPSEDTDVSVAGLPEACTDGLDDRRTETDRDGTTFVGVGLRCEDSLVTAFAMDWSDWK